MTDDERLKNARCALDAAGRVCNLDISDFFARGTGSLSETANVVVGLADIFRNYLNSQLGPPKQISVLYPEVTHHSDGATGWEIKDEAGVVVCRSPKRYKSAKQADNSLVQFMRIMGKGQMND